MDSKTTRSILTPIVIFGLIFFSCTGTYLFVSSHYYLDNHHVRVSVQSSQDYDATGCNGYPLDYRIQEQRRILSSVRKELAESSKRLDEVTAVYEDLNKKIPELQLELSSIEGEIESARRTLQELRDRRNVPIYLPHRPLFADRNVSATELTQNDVETIGFDDLVDYSRCSISSFMPIYLYPNEDNPLLNDYHSEFGEHATLTENPMEACLFVALLNITDSSKLPTLPYWNNGLNHVLINTGEAQLNANETGHAVVFERSISYRKSVQRYPLYFNVPSFDENLWEKVPSILPYSRKFLLTYIIPDTTSSNERTESDSNHMLESSAKSQDSIQIVRCGSRAHRDVCLKKEALRAVLESSLFCAFEINAKFHWFVWESLRLGCIPVVLSADVKMPFDDMVDWSLASFRIPPARIPELHFMLRSFSMSDMLEMRRQGRIFFDSYLSSTRAITTTLLSYLRTRLMIPSLANVEKAVPLFNSSFAAPTQTPINKEADPDDEYLGPLEGPVDSPMFQHNFSSLQMYSHRLWNAIGDPSSSPEVFPFSIEPPTETEFYEDSSDGFRPIEPGSGDEFSRALGGNQAREQFTAVLVTYNRDVVLSEALIRLHRLPYLRSVVVIWNNVGRDPPAVWPRLHVPVQFVKVDKNSLNNRFIPWDIIQTEAVLSLDDDIDLKQHEIIFAFRVWRENRDRIVGFPARYHARYGDSMFYNSNHTCQHSMILTGAAFIHKWYFNQYTNRMPPAIRHHIDDVMNCEDIAMNFLVSHLTRKPPIKTTSKWTLRCPTCTETLSQDESHFQERHECIRLFTRIYGYNPLRFSQFRADSVLFKTRLPPNKQKCFKYV